MGELLSFLIENCCEAASAAKGRTQPAAPHRAPAFALRLAARLQKKAAIR
jgi:hypothetical protein